MSRVDLFQALCTLSLPLVCCFPLSGQTPGTPSWVVIARDGQALAAIVVPADADIRPNPNTTSHFLDGTLGEPSVLDAAELLSRYVRLSTQAALPVVRDQPDRTRRPLEIHVGRTLHVKRFDFGLDALDRDGFVIAFPDARHIVIAGGGVSGTEFGVYEFLERHVGVRWLFAGTLGEHVPQHRTLSVRTEAVKAEPAFLSRTFSGLTPEGETWGRRNRMCPRLYFHHSLQKLFPPETYTKTHPHFFPVIDGKRFLPPRNNTHDWHPCFSAEGIVQEAVANTRRYFAAHPEAVSYSLGVSDAPLSGYCQCDVCRSAYSGRKNVLGFEDRSDIYYAWCNRVVAGVNQPGKYFGCLAYREFAAPPTKVRPHHRLVPCITYDRMKWVDALLEQEGHRFTELWAGVSPMLGWYDYIHSSDYLVPRVWFHKMAACYRYGYSHHVRVHYAEAYPGPDWHDGPNLYLSLRLQWDPYLDVDKALNDWYEACVGNAAARHLAAYFAFWEEFWTERVPKSAWFQSNRKGLYLPFSTIGYLDVLTLQDLASCEELLRQTVQEAEGERQQARARRFLEGFLRRKAGTVGYRLAAAQTQRDLASRSAARVLVRSEFGASLDGWDTWQRPASRAGFRHDKDVGRLGPGSAAVDLAGSEGSVVFVRWKIAVEQGRPYRASAWCRIHDLSPGAVVGLTAKWQDQEEEWLGDELALSSPPADAGRDDWQRLCLHFIPPSKAPKVPAYLVWMLSVKDSEGGVVWFDEAQLEELEAD